MRLPEHIDPEHLVDHAWWFHRRINCDIYDFYIIKDVWTYTGQRSPLDTPSILAYLDHWRVESFHLNALSQWVPNEYHFVQQVGAAGEMAPIPGYWTGKLEPHFSISGVAWQVLQQPQDDLRDESPKPLFPPDSAGYFPWKQRGYGKR